MSTSQTPAGHYVRATTTGEEVSAFVPDPLPPALDLRPLAALLESAGGALGRLDGLVSALPDTKLFIYLYVPEGGDSFLADRGNAVVALGAAAF